jgi:uncharacterized cupin superfamily protein
VRIGRPAIEPLCQAVNDPDNNVRREAAEALAGLRSTGIWRNRPGEWERIAEDSSKLAYFGSLSLRNNPQG